MGCCTKLRTARRRSQKFDDCERVASGWAVPQVEQGTHARGDGLAGGVPEKRFDFGWDLCARMSQHRCTGASVEREAAHAGLCAGATEEGDGLVKVLLVRVAPSADDELCEPRALVRADRALSIVLRRAS